METIEQATETAVVFSSHLGSFSKMNKPWNSHEIHEALKPVLEFCRSVTNLICMTLPVDITSGGRRSPQYLFSRVWDSFRPSRNWKQYRYWILTCYSTSTVSRPRDEYTLIPAQSTVIQASLLCWTLVYHQDSVGRNSQSGDKIAESAFGKQPLCRLMLKTSSPY